MGGQANQRRAGERGQVLPLVVIMMSVLIAFSALAVDVGRFLSERRFLQNAVDAAALAGALAVSDGKSVSQAEDAARAALSRNFAGDPTGRVPAQPSAVPLYEPGHEGDPLYLVEGILVGPASVRVAVRHDVDYTFGRIAGLTEQEIPARAHAGLEGGLLPIAVRQFIQAPGPEPGAVAPCPHNEGVFMAVFATANTACLGSETDAFGRTDASAGADFNASDPNNDPANHGPIIAILGQGASPANASDFRGFIALDIRNFRDSTSQVYYNGVTSGTSPNAIKDIEAAWILSRGYPGPGFPAATSPPHPDNQVAILSGNSAGQVVTAMESRYFPGEEILVSVYPGRVMAIPDFTIAQPPAISLPETGTVADAGQFRVSRNQAFNGHVTMSTVTDSLDPDNPLNLGTLTSSPPITYDPNPVSPSLGAGAPVTMRNITTAAATPGIYTLWVRGEASSPYLTAKQVPLAVKVGTVTRDFSLSADASGKVAQNAGDTVTFTLTLSNHPAKNTDFGGSVALSVDAPLPAGSSVSLVSNATPSRNGTNVTLSINTTGMTAGRHEFVVRASGMNTDTIPRKVTHLLPLTVNVAPSSSSGSGEYVDLTGFAVMRIAGITANTITAYAITPVIADPQDPRLNIGKPPRLLPW